MISCSRISTLGLAVLAASACTPGQAARGETAVQVAFGAPDNIFPNTGTTHLWQFTVTVPIEVTHLGL